MNRSPPIDARLSRLMTQLCSLNANERLGAVKSMQSINRALEPALLLLRNHLEDDSLEVVKAVQETLALVGAPTLPSLLEVIDDPQLSWKVIEILRRMLQTSLGMLHKVRPTATAEGRAHIDAIAAKAIPAVPTLVRCLTRGHDELNSLARVVLIALGPAIVPTLLEERKEADLQTRSILTELITTHYTDDIQAIIQLIVQDPEAGDPARRALATIGPGVIPSIRPLLSCENPAVRYHGAALCDGFGAPAVTVLDALAPLLGDELWDTQQLAARTLLKIRAAQSDSAIVPGLTAESFKRHLPLTDNLLVAIERTVYASPAERRTFIAVGEENEVPEAYLWLLVEAARHEGTEACSRAHRALLLVAMSYSERHEPLAQFTKPRIDTKLLIAQAIQALDAP